MIEVSKELFYKIIDYNRLDVVVSSHFRPDMAECEFKFRDGLLFGRVVEDRLTPYPRIGRYYIAEFYHKKYNAEK